MIFKGTVHKYGDHVNTDVILPARFCTLTDPKELALHCLEDLDSHFIDKVASGDILVGGFNFGCGSSREVAPIAIKACGISCVVANSFSRFFYRNCINIGLLIIESPVFVDDVGDGHHVEIDFDEGRIVNLTLNKHYGFSRDNGVIRSIVSAGGLVNFVKEEMNRDDRKENKMD